MKNHSELEASAARIACSGKVKRALHCRTENQAPTQPFTPVSAQNTNILAFFAGDKYHSGYGTKHHYGVHL